MSLETFVSVDIHQALGALDQLSRAAKQLQQAVNIKVTADTQAATTALDNLKNRVNQIKQASGETIKIKVDVSDVSKQADAAVRQLRSLQKASAAIKVQANVTEALTELQKVLDIVRELKQSAAIVINVQVNGGAMNMLTSLHQQLVQLNGAGVNWSATQTQMTKSGNKFVAGLKKIYEGFSAIGRVLATVSLIKSTFESAYHALFDFSNIIAQTNVGLTTLFDGNQGKADRLLKTLQQYAVKTPFNVKDLAPLTQQALAFQLLDKNSKTLKQDLISLFNDVGNAAYGLGRGKEGIDRIMLAFGQMHTAGRVMGQDMLQLQAVGVNAWKYLAEATGKSTAEVRKMVEEGLIPADAAIKTIREGMAHDFGGGMARGAKTLEGAFAQLTDTLDNLKASVLGDVFASLTESFNKLADIVSTDAFKQWIYEVVGRFQTGFAFMSGAVLGFIDVIKTMSPIILPILAAVGAKFLWMGGVAVVKAMKNAIVALANFVAFLPPQLTLAIVVVGAFVIAYKKNFLGIKTFTDEIAWMITNAIGKIGEGFYWLLSKMKQFLDAIPNTALGILHPGIIPLKFALEKLDPESLKIAAKNATDSFSDKILVGGVGDIITDTTKPFTDMIQKGLASINPFAGFGKMMQDAQAEANKAMADYERGASIQKGSLQLTDADKKGKGKKLGAGKDDVSALKKNLTDAAKFWDDYAKSIESAAKRQIDALKGVADTITGMVDDLKKDLLKNGILNDPLQSPVNKLMRDMNLQGQAAGIAQGAARQLSYAGAQAQKYRGQAEGLGGASSGGAVISGAVAGATNTATAALIKQIGNSVQSGAPAASCAYTASKILQAIGIKVPTVPGAKALRDKVVAMGARQIPFSQAQAGDLVVQSGAKFGAMKFGGIGYHTTIAEGGGKVLSSSGRRVREYHPVSGNPVAYTFRGTSQMPQTPVPQMATGAVQGLPRPQDVAANATQAILDAARNIPTRGSKIYAVPQQWLWNGGAVKDAPDSKARFGFQQWLTTQQGHDWFEGAAAQTPGGKMAVAQKFRSDVNAIDVSRNAANIKTATDATEKFVKGKKDEIAAIQESTKWLQNNSYNSIEYKKAMDIAAAATKAKQDIDQTGIPIAQRAALVDQQVAAATEKINAQLRANAFTDHIKRVADLDKQYDALHDTTIQQIATRKVLSREDAAYLSQQEKQLEIAKEIRNEQAKFAQDAVNKLRGQTLDMQLKWQNRNAPQNPVEQLRQSFEKFDAERKLVDPSYVPSLDMILLRMSQLLITTKQWNFDSAKKSLETFNDALKDTELTTAKVAALIQANKDALAKGDLGEDGAFSQKQIDQLLRQGSIGDINQSLKPLTNQVNDFVKNYQEQIEKLQHADDPLYDTTKQLNGLRDALAAAKTQAMAMGVYDDMAGKFDKVGKALDGIDVDKIRQLQQGNAVKDEFKNMSSTLRDLQTINSSQSELQKWVDGLKEKQIPDGVIEKMIPFKKIMQRAQATRSAIDSLMGGIQSTLSDGFKALFEEGPKNFFKNLLNGLVNTLNQMATEILTSMAMKYLTNLASGAFGGTIIGGGGQSILGAVANVAVPALLGGGGSNAAGQAMAGLVGGDAAAGPIWLASGMPTVPYDGMPAVLHKDEAVLTAQQAQQWRREQRDMAKVPSSGGSSYGSGSVTVVNQYHIGQVVASKPEEFTKKIPGQRVAAGEIQRQAALLARQGAKRI